MSEVRYRLDTDREQRFRMVISGGDFDSTQTHHIGPEGTYWKADITIQENAGDINDVLTVNGNVRHIIAPHGEDEDLDGVGFQHTLDSDGQKSGEITIKDKTIEHGADIDIVRAKLSYTIESTAGFDDITSWTITIIGRHVSG